MAHDNRSTAETLARIEGVPKIPVARLYRKGIENFVFFEKLGKAKKEKFGKKRTSKVRHKANHVSVFFEKRWTL